MLMVNHLIGFGAVVSAGTPTDVKQTGAVTTGANGNPWTNIDRSFAVLNSVSVTHMLVYASGATHNGHGYAGIVRRDSAGNYTHMSSVELTHGKTGWESFEMSYTTPGTGTLYCFIHWDESGTFTVDRTSDSFALSQTASRPVTTLSGVTETSAAIFPCGYTYLA